MRLQRCAITAATLLATLALAATASAAVPSLVVGHLRLDAYSGATAAHTPPVSSPRLTKGKLYVATVQGTISFYAAIDYLAIQKPFTAFCGRPLRAPLFSSTGGTGMVGNDAQFIFAQPVTGTACATLKLPRAWLNFQANEGFGWAHPKILSARPVRRPNASHRYSYALVGQNRPVRFDLDDPNTRDDYGSLHITLRRALPSDCAGSKWKAFAVKSRNVCLGSTAHTTGSLPRFTTARPLTTNQGPVVKVVRNSDVPTAHNVEFPAGALGAGTFARYDTTGAGAAAWSHRLAGAGLVSAAISQFTGPGLPTIKSTAVRFKTAAGAQTILAATIARATHNQIPAGDTAAIASDAAIPGAQLITFAPASGSGRGGLELVVAAGVYVDTLRELQTPDVVTPTQVEQLLATVTAR